MNGHLEVVQWLHARGAPLDVANTDGWQPIHLACLAGHLEVVQWLHTHGVPLDVQRPDGRRPVDLAGSDSRVGRWLQEQAAAASKAADELCAAAEAGDLARVQAALAAGAAIDCVDSAEGATPIHFTLPA